MSAWSDALRGDVHRLCDDAPPPTSAAPMEAQAAWRALEVQVGEDGLRAVRCDRPREALAEQAGAADEDDVCRESPKASDAERA